MTNSFLHKFITVCVFIILCVSIDALAEEKQNSKQKIESTVEKLIACYNEANKEELNKIEVDFINKLKNDDPAAAKIYEKYYSDVDKMTQKVFVDLFSSELNRKEIELLNILLNSGIACDVFVMDSNNMISVKSSITKAYIDKAFDSLSQDQRKKIESLSTDDILAMLHKMSSPDFLKKLYWIMQYESLGLQQKLAKQFIELYNKAKKDLNNRKEKP